MLPAVSQSICPEQGIMEMQADKYMIFDIEALQQELKVEEF